METLEQKTVCKPVESLEQLHAIELEALRELDRVCRIHGIHWFLHGGTLLGAIREGGPLPWDDDVDVSMLREDYERFKAVAASELDPRFKLVEPADYDEFFDFLPRLTDTGYAYRNMREDAASFGGRLDHPDIDIFVFDRACDDAGADRRQALALKVNYAKALGHRPHIDRSIFSGAALLASYVLPALGRCTPLRSLVAKRDALAARGDSDSTMIIANEQPAYWHLRWQRSWYDGERRVPFSGVELPVPFAAEDVLVNIYGADWRTPPPVEQQVPQHASLGTGAGFGSQGSEAEAETGGPDGKHGVEAENLGNEAEDGAAA